MDINFNNPIEKCSCLNDEILVPNCKYNPINYEKIKSFTSSGYDNIQKIDAPDPSLAADSKPIISSSDLATNIPEDIDKPGSGIYFGSGYGSGCGSGLRPGAGLVTGAGCGHECDCNSCGSGLVTGAGCKSKKGGSIGVPGNGIYFGSGFRKHTPTPPTPFYRKGLERKTGKGLYFGSGYNTGSGIRGGVSEPNIPVFYKHDKPNYMYHDFPDVLDPAHKLRKSIN